MKKLIAAITVSFMMLGMLSGCKENLDISKFNMLKEYPFDMNTEKVIKKADKQFGEKSRKLYEKNSQEKVETLEEANRIDYDGVTFFKGYLCDITFFFDNYKDGNDLLDTIFWTFYCEPEEGPALETEIEQYLDGLYGKSYSVSERSVVKYRSVGEIDIATDPYNKELELDWDDDGKDEGCFTIYYTDNAKLKERQQKDQKEKGQ